MIQKIKYIITIQLISIAVGQFGQNIVQYDDFTWHFIQSKHFDIYYAEDGRSHAEFTAEEAEVAYLKISDRLNWRLKSRVSIIVYNSHNDFQQTNVVDSYMFEGIGGVTELYKNRIVIPFDASNQEFKHVIHHELVHAFINDSVYGGSLKNMVASSIKVHIPMWMNEGLAEYLSSGWDTNSEMWIRDLAINGGEFPQIRQLTGYMAYRGGQSVWNFITEKWGEESIAEIFYQLKKSNKVETGFKRALGVDLKKLNEQWHQYLKEQYWPDVANRENIPDFARQLTDHEELENTYNVAPAISPDGSRIAIFSNKSGPMAIYLISAEDGRFIKKIIQGERNSEFEELHILKPGITWSEDSKKVAFAAKSGKSDALFIVDLKSGKRKKHRLNMEGIFRPAWRPGTNEIAFIGNNGKSSDIYLFNLDSEKLTNLTKDWFTDDQISWYPDGNSILFISDRGNILKTGIAYKPENHLFNQTDIYELNIESGNIERITDTPFNEMYPCISNDSNYLAFISDEIGINNIYIYSNIQSQKILQNPQVITNVLTGITQLSWNGDDTQLIFTGFFNKGYDIYTFDNPIQKVEENIQVAPAAWTLKFEKLELLRNDDTRKSKSFISADKYKNYVFSGFDATENVHAASEIVELDTSAVYDSTGLYRTHLYKTRFTLDFAQAYYAFDTRYGGQGMAYFLFSDILGDHKLQLGTEMVVDLQRSDYFLLYRLLPYKIDWNFVFYHLAYQYSSLYSNNYYSDITLFQNIGSSVSASKPLSRFNRIDGGIDFNHIIKSNITTLYDNYNQPYDEKINHISSFTTVIPSIKYTWDNALWSYTYPIEGFRYYLKYRTSPGINEKSLSFHTATMDGRKYFRLFNGVSFAGRFFAGANWGTDAQKFRLGGVPWLFSSDRYSERFAGGQENAPDIEELYFSEYVMPLRGVQISNKFGQNVFLANLELRLPFLIYYFPAIKYLGQINGVLFTDIGVTWDSDYPEFWDNSNWQNNNNTGWLMSYGFGPRFIFLGMPWQLDYAWEYNPHKGTISDRKWYLTIGLDF
ncbi:MAG: PD40 domain-containing protein [Candidatus Marinimicrobia bacterium]|nr:PD40 domain-containing protein [Candidatus Neomarinimicrobiota bacterium]